MIPQEFSPLQTLVRVVQLNACIIVRTLGGHTMAFAGIVAVLMFFNLSLISWSRFSSVTEHLPLILLLSIISFLILSLLKLRMRQTTVAVLFMVVLSASGMLVGSVADFGRFGLQVLAELCAPSVGGSTWSDMIRMIKLAPLSHVGMLMGCMAGFFTLCKVCAITAKRGYVDRWVWQIIHAVGMFAGMFAGVMCARFVFQYGRNTSNVSLLDFPSMDIAYSALLFNWLGMIAAALLLFTLQRHCQSTR